ncbi:helix-turn-helix domain-containing protein [Dankookia rubra]|uniref:Helix-turn-helix domain-containing protein n=1 Tax=Dankookia rubra TaxID=1442381 RepID=A0A4R5QIT6_9PROT|nr:helix-turn-helix domain-containing protein [Dankookia rubra]TDH62689.1 helix-turn-helix domain-containing protein [Dankookia rubra]
MRTADRLPFKSLPRGADASRLQACPDGPEARPQVPWHGKRLLSALPRRDHAALARGEVLLPIPLAHELLAEMLGVHRATLSPAPLAPRNERLVRIRHGHVRVPDFAALKQAACGYGAALRRRFAPLAEDGEPRATQ